MGALGVRGEEKCMVQDTSRQISVEVRRRSDPCADLAAEWKKCSMSGTYQLKKDAFRDWVNGGGEKCDFTRTSGSIWQLLVKETTGKCCCEGFSEGFENFQRGA